MTTFRFNIAVFAALVAGPVHAIDVPSGIDLYLHEVLFADNAARFRFVAPEIARDLEAFGFDDVADDFAHLCAVHALPALEKADKPVQEIVISISDRVTEFGIGDPEVTQFFEAFAVENATCIWKEF